MWCLVESFDTPLSATERGAAGGPRPGPLRLSSGPADDVRSVCRLCWWFSLLAMYSRRPPSSSEVTKKQIPVPFHRQMPRRAADSTAVISRRPTPLVRSATESAYFGSRKHCPSGFGNVGIAFVADAPAAAAEIAAAGCIPQCFAAGR